MSELSEAINEMRTMREAYNELVEQTSAVGLATKEIEASKDAMVEAINAQGGTATEQMGIAQLAQAIGTIPNIQLGGVEFDVPISSVAQAIALLPSNCTKLVDNLTETTEYLNQIPVGWQKLEEVEFNALRIIDFRELELGSASQYKALANCPNLKSIKINNLHEIIATVGNEIFFAVANLYSLSANSLYRIVVNRSVASSDITTQVFAGLGLLGELDLPAISSVEIRYSGAGGYAGTRANIFSGLVSVTELNLPTLSSIYTESNYRSNSSQIFSGLNSITQLSLPSLTSISSIGGTEGNSSQIFSGLTALTRLYLPSVTSISSSYGHASIFSGAVGLEYIEIGHTTNGVGSITGNLYISINPTSTYADAAKLAALNASIRDHWFANLRDYISGTTHTLTLPTAFVQHMEAETIQVATDKNWTIVTF